MAWKRLNVDNLKNKSFNEWNTFLDSEKGQFLILCSNYWAKLGFGKRNFSQTLLNGETY